MNYSDFKPFCSKDFSRVSIMVPILIGDWLYALDGHLCIRAQGVKLPEGFGKVPPKDMSAWPEPSETILSSLPGFFQEEPRGLKRVRSFPEQEPRVPCFACDQTGKIVCEACDHENECTGCWGEGYAQKDIKLDLGGVYMSANLLGRIRDLPELEIELRPWDRLKGQRFRFLGGEGIIMPLKYEPEHEYLKFDLFSEPAAPAPSPAPESEGLDLEALERMIESARQSTLTHSEDEDVKIATKILHRLRAGAEGGDVGMGAEALRKAFMEGAEWFHNRIDGQPYPSQEEAEKFAEEMFPLQPSKPISAIIDHAMHQILCCMDGGSTNAPYEAFRALESEIAEWLGRA